MRNLIWIAYVVVGIVVAADRNYFEHLGNVDDVASAILAVVLWPLLVLDIDVTLR
jgi:spore maturation protein SpmA